MNKFAQDIIKPFLLEQTEIKTIIGIYAGRFQPFGLHHLKTYQWLSSQFDHAYIATSDKTGSSKHPLNFKQKKSHMVKMGVPSNKIVKEKMPYVAKKILSKFDATTTAVVYIFGEKDAGRLMSGKYFQDYKAEKDNLQGYEEHGYILVAPHASIKVDGQELSGTVMRKLLSSDADDKTKKKLFKKLFGYYNDALYKMFTGVFVNESLAQHGYPNKKELDRYMGKVKKQRKNTDSNKKYQFDPVNEAADIDEVAGVILYTIQDGQPRYLLLQDDDYWSFPKGHLKQGESLLDGATREAYEETGISPGTVDPKFFHEMLVHFGTNKERTITLFLSMVHTTKVTLSDEHQDYKWATAEEVEVLIKQPTVTDLLNRLDRHFITAEEITVPIEIGDVVLGGKFKNKRITVKTIGKNDKGDIAINGRPLLKYRLITQEDIERFICSIDMKKFIGESSGIGSMGIGVVDDGPRYWYGNQKTYRKTGEDEAAKLGFKVVNYLVPDMEFEEHDTNYPNGPTGTVTYFPAGKVGTKSGTGVMKDMRGSKAWKSWAQNISRSIKQLGWEFSDWLGAKDSIKQTKNEPIDEFDPRNEVPPDTEPKGEKDQHGEMEDPPDDPDGLNEPHKKDLSERALSVEWWRQLITEGGAYGHMAHPFDDWDLTFKDFKNIIEMGLDGTLNREDNVTEKLDGQNLMVSWNDRGLVVARNKGHIKNAGKTALSVKGIASMFRGRGEISNAFTYAAKDLEKSIGSLSNKQQEKIFMNGKAWMNLEVLWPASANVIDYDVAQIVFHGALEYNDAGTVVGQVKGSARTLEGMIRQVNQHIQSHYKIAKPQFLSVPKNQNFGSRKTYYFNKLKALQNTYALSDSDPLALWHQMFWQEWIMNGANQTNYTNITNDVLVKLMKRWAFGDKSYKIPNMKKELKEDHPEFLDWVLSTDKVDVQKMQKQNMKPFEVLFFELGAEILRGVSNFLAVNPSKAAQKMKSDTKKAAAALKRGKDPKDLILLKTQLEKLQAIGGFDAIVPSEGLVFKYKGNTYKFTGAFAPVNQVIGALKFGR